MGVRPPKVEVAVNVIADPVHNVRELLKLTVGAAAASTVMVSVLLLAVSVGPVKQV